ncbi:MAG: T9SS type A sorting domain-containing protein [Bacteroidetes bacterium]|nr:T9SS type A sorting domain-containing protein [Bacteroidota bacterium]
MKKSFVIILTLTCLIQSYDTRAQIVINNLSSAQVFGRDTFGLVYDLSSFTDIYDHKSGGNWDLTSLTYASSLVFERNSNTSVNFPSASFQEDIYYPFGGGLSYDAVQASELNSNHLSAIGEEIVTEQTIAIGAFTGNSNDKLVFPVQKITYSTPETELKFPVKHNDNYIVTSKHTTSFNITLTLAGLNNSPGERRTTNVISDSVVGWGKIKVRDLKSGQHFEIDVLQTVYHVDTYDSFYLNGKPASIAILTAFGLSQGQLSTSVETRFIRKGEVSPLVTVYYDGASTDVPIEIDIHQNRLDANSVGINSISEIREFTFYPNPSDENVQIIFPDANENYTYSVTDMRGSVFCENTSGNQLDVSEFPAGSYFISFYKEGEFIGSRKLLVLH